MFCGRRSMPSTAARAAPGEIEAEEPAVAADVEHPRVGEVCRPGASRRPVDQIESEQEPLLGDRGEEALLHVDEPVIQPERHHHGPSSSTVRARAPRPSARRSHAASGTRASARHVEVDARQEVLERAARAVATSLPLAVSLLRGPVGEGRRRDRRDDRVIDRERVPYPFRQHARATSAFLVVRRL